jgi:hypothetical protein
MSADNWARCPRCDRRALTSFDERERTIADSYGKVSVEEFDQMRAALAKDRDDHVNARETFREDYEFFGAEDGAVTASYAGECQVCGLKLQFVQKYEIPGWQS